MTVTVARRYRFVAQHDLPGFAEPWCTPHSHQYTVEVVADSPFGRLTDTDRIDAAWAALAPAPGSDLNAGYASTTVEALACEWLAAVRRTVPEVVEVTVWEDDERWGRAQA